MEYPRYDDTDMTEEEFDRRLAAAIPANVYGSLEECEGENALLYSRIIHESGNRVLTENTDTLPLVSNELAEILIPGGLVWVIGSPPEQALPFEHQNVG